MVYIPGHNSKALEAEEYTRRKLEKITKEKHSSTLKELGKVSAFKEEFEGVKLENQIFPQIPTVDNIIENEYFIEGRKFGFTLIANGFDTDKYNAYTKSKEDKKTSKHR